MTTPRKTTSRPKAAPKTPKAVPKKAAPKKAEPKKAAPRKPAGLRQGPRGLDLALGALEDMKAVDIRVIDVRGHSDVTDFMVVASGNSDRHVRSVADRVVQLAKAGGIRPFGVEGAQEGEWVLVDLPDVMVHVMLPRAREFYQLEQLWEPAPAPRARPRTASKPAG